MPEAEAWKLKAVERIITEVYMKLNHSYLPQQQPRVPAPTSAAAQPAKALASSAAPIIARMNVNGTK